MLLFILITPLLSIFFLRRMMNLDLKGGFGFCKNSTTRLQIRKLLRTQLLIICRGLSSRECKSYISECFHDEQLFAIHSNLWFVDIVNQLVLDRIPKGQTKNDSDRYFYLVKYFLQDDSYLFKYCFDQVFRSCINDYEARSVISFCHDQAYGAILVGRRQQPKFFNVVFIELLYLGMVLSIIRVALNSNSWV